MFQIVKDTGQNFEIGLEWTLCVLLIDIIQKWPKGMLEMVGVFEKSSVTAFKELEAVIGQAGKRESAAF